MKTLQEFKQEIPVLNQAVLDSIPEHLALDICKQYYTDQSPSAREVLAEESWKTAAYIVWFLCDKFPAIVPQLKQAWDELQELASSTPLAQLNELSKEPLLIGFEEV